jgi:Leucine-rich repeat (LRR) protein
LTIIGSGPGNGKLTDISPIRGLPLTVLNVWENPKLADMSPVVGMKLTLFQAGDTAIEDITPFEGMPITTFAVNNCRVRDLTPVRTMPKLNYLRCDGCPITSLEPLMGSTIRKLTFTPEPDRGDEAVLKQLKLESVTRINRKQDKNLQNGGKP